MRFTETWCLGCSPLGRRPRRARRDGLRRDGPHRFVSRSLALRSSRTSSCLSPASPARASTVSGSAGRDMHHAMHTVGPMCLPCALCNALCAPARGIGSDSALRRARWTLRSPHASAPLPGARVGSLLTTPFQPSTLNPSDLQAEGRVRGCRQERRRNDTLFEQRQKVWQEGSGAQGAYTRNTADQRAQRAVTPLLC